MLSGIGERRISIRDRNVKAKNFPGAAIDVMYDYIKPLFKKRPDHITLHASTNNTVNKSSKTVLGKLLDLKKFIENTLPEISITLQSSFIDIALRHGCSPVNLLHIFRTAFYKNTSGWLLLKVLLSLI